MTRTRQTVEQSLIKIRGDEPVVTKDNYRSDLLRALNWYNANKEEQDFRQYLLLYIRSQPDLKQHEYAVTKASFLEVKPLAIISRLVMQEQYIAISDMLSLLVQLDALSRKYVKKPAVIARAVEARVVSVQERIAESAGKYVSEINNQIDEYVRTRETPFSMKSYLLSNAISGAVAKKIGEHYVQLAKELRSAYSGTDPQLKEGYSNFTKPALRKFAEFVEQIIADCTQQTVSAKAQRKPRAKKEKPASVIAAKLKPMKEFPELGLKSVEPAKIVGASEVYAYNTASRKLTVFRAADGPLSVSGMSVANYDVAKSETKTLRKPDEFFKNLLPAGKRAMANAWKSIRAKAAKARGRITDDVIIVAVY